MYAIISSWRKYQCRMAMASMTSYHVKNKDTSHQQCQRNKAVNGVMAHQWRKWREEIKMTQL